MNTRESIEEALDWEKRRDGMYLKVSENEEFDFSVLKRTLNEQGIMNYDWPRIQTVVEEARDTFEFVGPVFQFFNKKKHEFITVQANRNVAHLKLSHKVGMFEDIEITSKDIEFKLKEQNIVFGVDWSAISEILHQEKYGEFYVIAHSQPPVHGKTAQMIEKIRVDPDAKPISLVDGRVDFKNIENIRMVQKGDLIAHKLPASRGKPGIDIYNNPIDPIVGKDCALPVGKNTVASENKQKLFAAASGYLYRDGPSICVGELLVVPENVGFKTGNIKYSGDVVVLGDVQSGFEIEAGGNIKIEGDVEAAAIISKGGDVNVDKGVFGKDKGIIEAKRNITLEMAQDVTIKCGGVLKVHKSIRNSKTLSEEFEGTPSCITCGNQITALSKIEVYNIGVQGTPNHLSLLNQETKKKQTELEKVEKGIEIIAHNIEPLEKRIRGIKSMLKKVEGPISPKMQEELKGAVIQYKKNAQNLELLKKKKEALEKEIKEPTELPGRIFLREVISPDTSVDFYEEEWSTKVTLKNLEFVWTTEGLVTKPLAGKSKS